MTWPWNKKKIAEQVTEALEHGHAIRICKQCDHYWVVDHVNRCRAFQTKVRHLVTGKMEWTGGVVACQDNRNQQDPRWCGKEGRFWKPRRPWRERHPVAAVILLSSIGVAIGGCVLYYGLHTLLFL